MSDFYFIFLCFTALFILPQWMLFTYNTKKKNQPNKQAGEGVKS